MDTGTFWFMIQLWRISLHMGQVFLTYVPHVYFVLCLHHDEFLFIRVKFFQLMCLMHIRLYTFVMAEFLRVKFFLFIYFRHILLCVSTMTDFSSCKLGSLDSCVLDTFCLVPSL